MLREALTLDRLGELDPSEAAALFVARRAEGLTPSEEDLLAAWLAADAGHARALDRADRAWGAFADSEGDEILAEMRAHARASRPRPMVDWRRFAAIAAILVLVLGSGTVLLTLNRPQGPGPGGQIAAIEYTSAPGQVREVKLADGSTMTLDGESKARARLGPAERAIELVQGRAFFEVEPDRSRPFSVTAAARRVVAIGTRFEVDLGADGLRVTLLHGRVDVAPLRANGRVFTLIPGQQFVEGAGGPLVQTAPTAGDTAMGWNRGLIGLDDRPLAEAATQINRYSRNQIVIRDPAVGAMRISGQFRTGDAERFARTVAEVYPVRVIRHGNEIELARSN
jgi:transmembrane sensor